MEFLQLLLRISLVIFMAGNLLDMGLRLNPQDVVRGLRNVRFVVQTFLWASYCAPRRWRGATEGWIAAWMEAIPDTGVEH